MSADRRIIEIEKSPTSIETKIIDKPQEILGQIRDIAEKTDTGVSICSLITGLELLNNSKPLLQCYKALVQRHKEGKVKNGVRWIVYIENNKDQVALVKKFIDMGFSIRHMNTIPFLSFGVSEKQYQSTIEKMTGGQMIHNLLHSTDPLYLEHFQALFDDLWNSAIDVEERLRQIETGITFEFTKLIENSVQAKQYFIETVQNAKEEILILFPSLNAVKREVAMGFIDVLKQKSLSNVRIRILSPVNEGVRHVLYSNTNNKDLIVESIICREIQKQKDLISTIVIVDKKFVLATELKDDSKESFEEAVGVTTYSTSQPTVLSYVSIFESLWTQTEMSEHLKIANEKLVRSEELEREFINTAAHELRTPTQAIMGYTEMDAEVFEELLKNTLVSKEDELNRLITQLKKHFDAVSRNSIRLDDLISKLLDVARIESNRIDRLQLHKEKLDLIGEINDTIKTGLTQKLKGKDIQVSFINENLDEHCWVYADRIRINQIINNLMDNAIKSIGRKGKIDIIIRDEFTKTNNLDIPTTGNASHFIKGVDTQKKKEETKMDRILVGISDTGKGIPSQIMTRLFEKFNTDSERGTGLGLFITKSLVEAHDGKIWGFNNKDGVGATFVFTLPKVKDMNADNIKN
jgi:signal transduction histidine kinase